MSFFDLLLLPFTLLYLAIRLVTYIMLILYLSFLFILSIYGVIALLARIVHFGAWDVDKGFYWLGMEGYEDVDEDEAKKKKQCEGGKETEQRNKKERRKSKDDIWIGAKRPVRVDGRRMFL